MTEIFRTAIYDGEIYEGYEVSNLGRVKSLNYNRTGRAELMNPVADKDGYLQVVLCKNKEKKTCKVHRLVATAFLENPEGKPEVNHIDEDKTNNFVFLNEDGSVDKEKSNLEWCDRNYNINYGTRTERISKKVLQLSLDGELIREWPSIGECGRNGFYQSAVWRCCNGKLKTHKGFRFMYK
jgi:hypothetical protein